jgi:hypothetical protein
MQQRTYSSGGSRCHGENSKGVLHGEYSVGSCTSRWTEMGNGCSLFDVSGQRMCNMFSQQARTSRGV